MSQVIKSGSSGNILIINNEGQLLGRVRSASSEEHRSDGGQSFILSAECHLSASINGGLMAFKNTDPSDHVHITRLYFDSLTANDDIIIYQVKNPTISNGTNVSTTNIINKNFENNRTLSGVLTVSDASSDLTYTGGSKYHSFVLEAKKSRMRDMMGTNVLGNNNMVLFGWATLDGANAVDGDKISISLNCFVEAKE